MKSLVTQSVVSLNRVTQVSVIGTATTAFTIYSHVDGFFNLSKTIKALAAVWRDIIAFVNNDAGITGIVHHSGASVCGQIRL